MTTERRYLEAVDLRFVQDEGKPPTVEGYAAVFNSPSLPLSTKSGRRFVESIAPGAFRQALATSGNVVFQIEHDGLALADTATRTLTVYEDERGLRIRAELDPSDPDAQRVIPKLARGTLRSMSFGFTIAQSGDTWEQRDGMPHRTLRDIAGLSDVSLVTRPAYPATEAALRSLDAWEQQEQPAIEPPAETPTESPTAAQRNALLRSLID